VEPETVDEIEARLAGGGPAWESAVMDIIAGMPTGEALESVGVSRVRRAAWLRRNRARALEVEAAEAARGEKRKEEIEQAALDILKDEDAPTSAKIKVMELLGRDVGLFKQEAMDRMADSLEAILARSYARTVTVATVEALPALSAPEGSEGG